MNKNSFKNISILVLIGSLIGLSACRKDDICTEPATPKLGVGFYDESQPDEKKAVAHLTLVALPVLDTLITDKTIDSIAIPLNVNADNCRFILQQDTNKDTLVFQYQIERVFVSKACGYKAIFHQLQVALVPDNNNWIKQIELLKNEILEDTIHLKILH